VAKNSLAVWERSDQKKKKADRPIQDQLRDARKDAPRAMDEKTFSFLTSLYQSRLVLPRG
jgi:hypothetical protein